MLREIFRIQIRAWALVATTLLTSECVVPLGATAAKPPTHYEALADNGWLHSAISFDDVSLRITSPNKTVLVSSAPKWQIYLFNPAKKLMYETTEEHLRTGALFKMQPLPILTPPINETPSKTFGLSTKLLACDAKGQEVWGMNDAINVFFKTRPTSQPAKYEQLMYTVWNGKAPLQVCHIVEGIYRLPEYPQLPIRFLFTISGEHRVSCAFAMRNLIRKDGKVDSQKPAGYKLCKTAEELLIEPKVRDYTDFQLKLWSDDPQASKHNP
jgi:hypothetical protein